MADGDLATSHARPDTIIQLVSILHFRSVSFPFTRSWPFIAIPKSSMQSVIQVPARCFRRVHKCKVGHHARKPSCQLLNTWNPKPMLTSGVFQADH